MVAHIRISKLQEVQLLMKIAKLKKSKLLVMQILKDL